MVSQQNASRKKWKVIVAVLSAVVFMPLFFAVGNQLIKDHNKKQWLIERNRHINSPIPFDSAVWKRASTNNNDAESKRLLAASTRHRMLKDALLNHAPRGMTHAQLLETYGPYDKSMYGPTHKGYLLSYVNSKEEIWLTIDFDSTGQKVEWARFWCPLPDAVNVPTPGGDD